MALIKVYQKRINPNTGETIYDENNMEIMDLLEERYVPDYIDEQLQVVENESEDQSITEDLIIEPL